MKSPLLVGFALLWLSQPASMWSAQSAVLEWDANTQTNISGYKVYYGVASRNYTNAINVGNVTNAAISGLTEGVTYFFAATAYDTSGLESDYSDEVSYSVPVSVPNRVPTLNALSNLTINEDAGTQILNLSGISSGATNEVQTLTVTAVSSNPGLIADPVVNYTTPNSTGSLTFRPLAGANGSATVTVTVNDGQPTNNTFTRTFTVTVNAVNDPPTLNALNNLTINEDAGLKTLNLSGISSGAANEVQTLTVSAVSSNPGLIPNPVVNYSSPNSAGSLIFTAGSGAGGSATITVTVNDGQSTGNTITRAFTVTVNRLPTISGITNRYIADGTATAPIPFTISDAETAASNLTLSSLSSNPTLVANSNIVFGGTEGSRTVTITPTPGNVGSALITLTVGDGTGTASSKFQLSVQTRPSRPRSLKLTSN